MTTVSSTSSFCSRRRRRRLLGRQAAGRGTTFGAGCAARRAASAPSPPHHLHSTLAHSAPSVGRIAGTSWPDLGVRAQLLRSARASRRAAKGTRAGRWQVERWLGAAPSSDARLDARGDAAGGARGRRREEQGEAGQIVGRTHESNGVRGLVRASTLEEAAALAFFRVPRIYRRNHVQYCTGYRRRKITCG